MEFEPVNQTRTNNATQQQKPQKMGKRIVWDRQCESCEIKKEIKIRKNRFIYSNVKRLLRARQIKFM